MKPLAALLLAVGLSSACASTASHTGPAGSARVASLIAAWDARDGEASVNVGTALSEAFVTEPAAFLSEMSGRPSSWQSWLNSLQFNTFTAFVPERHASLESLHNSMSLAASRMASHPRYGQMAQALAVALEGIVVRDIR